MKPYNINTLRASFLSRIALFREGSRASGLFKGARFFHVRLVDHVFPVYGARELPV